MIRKKHDTVYCPKCEWSGCNTKCPVKHFGAYCGEGRDYDSWGWEEWDDMICPECESVVEFYDFDDDTEAT